MRQVGFVEGLLSKDDAAECAVDGQLRRSVGKQTHGRRGHYMLMASALRAQSEKAAREAPDLSLVTDR